MEGSERRSSVQHRPAPAHSLFWTPFLAIGAAALVVELPFVFFGTPSGHDVEFHLYSWLEVLSQWKHGIFYPRWAALANFGCGEPRFIFYPPASWTLGGLLSAVLPWNIAASAYLWVVLTAAGAAMFLLARRFFDRRDAVFAAVLYAVNPYHLVIVYWRSAFAELLASCLLPLLLLLAIRAVDGERRAVIPLSLLLAAAWLTNAPAAVMIHYSLALLLLIVAWQQRSVQPLLLGATAVALGACLSAFYLLPATYEQRWVNIAEAVSAGSRPADNFLFIHTTDPDHDAFNRIISWLAVFEITVTLATAWAARSWWKAKSTLWKALLAWAGACSVLMFSLTALLWKFLPKLAFMQFPWRWLLCLSLTFTIFVSTGVRRWWLRVVIAVAVLLVIAAGWHFAQSPWWDNQADLRELRDNVADGIGYEGVDEYAPVGSDLSAIEKDTRKVRVEGTAHAAIHVYQWDAEFKVFTAEMSAPGQLALRLLRYPAWNVEVNGRLAETTARDNGQMLVPVEAGTNRVQITFLRTWDRTAGRWISVATVLALIGWSLVRRRRIAMTSPALSS